MEIYFRNLGLERSCRSREGRVRRWGPNGALVARRLAELAALDNLADAQWIPGVRITEIDRETFEYRCEHGVRLVLTKIDSYAISSNGRVRVQRVVLENVAVNDVATDTEGESI